MRPCRWWRLVFRKSGSAARTTFFGPAEAREWQVQHDLLNRIREIVRANKLTHAQLAKQAGTSRTRITAILNDDLKHVSTDLLIRILGSLGYRVKVSVVRVKPAA